MNGKAHHFFLGFLAVFAAALKALAVGAPSLPTFRIVSFDPPSMRLRFAAMFEYKPFFIILFWKY